MIAFSRQEKLLSLGFVLGILLLVVWVWWGNRPQAPLRFIAVHVDGAIRNPGVYEVAEGTRVYELIERAGGTTEEADLKGLNLAAFLSDGQKIVIPARSQGLVLASSPPRGISSSTLVNVNTASASELETLPGIGKVLAQRIIEYREQNGPFQSLEDLLKVRGIGPKKLEQIKDHIGL